MAELTKDVIDTIIAEAGGDGKAGMTAAAWAIANRAAKSGISADAVVKKPHQFEGYSNPGSGSRRAQQNAATRAIVKEIWSGIESRTIADPLRGGTMFHASSMTPYWADEENKHGTVRIGGQTYYLGGAALPPGELPQVGTLTDTVPSRADPVTMSPDLSLMRATTAPSRLVADTFASLPKRRASSLADSLGLNPVQGGRQTAQPFDAAFDTRVGAMRLLGQPEAVSSQGIGFGASREPVGMPRRRPETAPSDLIETSFRRVASSNPTKLPTLAPSTLGQRAGQSLIERSPLPAAKVAAAPSRPRVTVSTPYTTPQSGIERGVARTVEPSPIGQPPATRVVQSVPMPPISRVAEFVPEVRYIEPRNGPPAATKYAGPFVPGTNIAQPNGSIIPNKSQDRLPVGVANNGIDISPGLSAVGAQAYAPTPHPPITRAPIPAPPYRAVAEQLDVREMPALPRRRPDLGMGGVDIAAPIAQTGQVAPVPMPRLERGGIFGKPQIFGHDVPLPGIFGVLQGATKAMNNASGPFNNGADNSLYDLLRGGDFNTPGAATVQSGGFRYAPRLGGGFINVGRVDPRISGAQTYANRTTNWGQDDAADRVNGRGGSSGARSISG